MGPDRKRLRWDQHFLEMALLIAAQSKDPATRVGCVIVGPEREVRSTGYNGFPRGIEDSEGRLNDRDTKLLLTVHAELNAMAAAARVGIPLAGCTTYIAATDDSRAVWGGPPCTRCAMHLIQAGIVCIVARPTKATPSKWHDDLRVSAKMLAEAGIEFREVPR